MPVAATDDDDDDYYCLGPSSYLRNQLGSPYVPVFLVRTLNTICNGYSCPLFDVICPTSPWKTMETLDRWHQTVDRNTHCRLSVSAAHIEHECINDDDDDDAACDAAVSCARPPGNQTG